ncbi:MAG TPA: FAD/NAD(P)-binding oxidoreductase, partial [Candidatus Acidoferrales bacterium]|nr:FAD/NAD(P)-binding oxidoreductase [Candidatus Acidoferrales bacterium]
MNNARRSFDVLVVGAGPAGIAAACCAAEDGIRVGIVDNNVGPGGQIWRGVTQDSHIADAANWFRRLASSRAEILSPMEVFSQPETGKLAAESSDGMCELSYRKLILCTGARERFLPFPGWTLPNVIGAGGLQALVKSGMAIAGRKVVIAGSGPLLLAVAAHLKTHGADVRVIAEQAPWSRLIRFGVSLASRGQKIAQSFQLKRQLSRISYRAGCWVAAAEGKARVESVTLRTERTTWREPCDYLACGFHLVPNTDLASLIGCELRGGFVRIDDFQESSVAGVYCAGEPTGIGGVELSIAEGQIAGHSAAGQRERAQEYFGERKSQRRFSAALERTFALRDELRTLPSAETIVCRCEDVRFDRLRGQSSWRAAKLQTRCGMGPCQGRICGPAVEFLFGWKAESTRPPIFPVPVESLAAT